jgi:hypothetical protein
MLNFSQLRRRLALNHENWRLRRPQPGQLARGPADRSRQEAWVPYTVHAIARRPVLVGVWRQRKCDSLGRFDKGGILAHCIHQGVKMRQKPGPRKSHGWKIAKDIRRETR